MQIAFLRIQLVIFCLLTIGGASPLCAVEDFSQTSIPRVEPMPKLPEPYAMRDWPQVTRDYIDLVFDFEQSGDHLPLIRWLDEKKTMVSMPAFIGGPRDPEAINFLGAVISGSLVGLDMRIHLGQDWVAMGMNFFRADEGVYLNRLHRGSGTSFWYDIFPNVLFYQLNDLYPDDPVRTQQALSVALKWHEACVALGGGTDPLTLPNFDHTGLNLKTMKPVELGRIEPEAAAGIAWLEYMAWVKFQDPRFLTAADWAIRSLQERPADQSPLYEVLLPYGALVAARMNAELGRDYDVARLVNDCFEPLGRPQARPGWGVISDRWNEFDAHGLVGSTTDGEGYAFAMNTFEWAGALVPLARYDIRYAHDIGKWILNLANASRLFYPDAHDAEHQSSFEWANAHDGKSVIAYEGIRKWKRGSATARSDFRTLRGKIVNGSFASTHYRAEAPPDLQVFEEESSQGTSFEHIWVFELPDKPDRWLVVAAKRIDGGHVGNAFHFSFSSQPEGPYTPAFSVSDSDSAHVVELPTELGNKLYVKAQSSDQSTCESGQDKLSVDAMAISYQSNIGPFAQGDLVVNFIDLLNEATVPIVLYRPASAATDLGLYGSSHVGILGGIIRRTNVEAILQLDLLKTDYFHGKAYPTYLYYNPYSSNKVVEVDVGSDAKDIYDAASDDFLQKNVCGLVSFTIPNDAARIVVLTPAGEEIRREGNRTLINDVVVRYTP
ncbi:hypothetical protein [Bythopirellula polymerisocia]|uniref:Uncharacterized protein n=1 Tax=Bythopirellula polymerisocia TaxID=2528003 RepID=A0A5C6D0C5_9BACT|nr:hypothetical protein [Bythopirellula polymerisocia]TWU28349.1 hypothetical protein Pla144_16370 [Bythopirellula polymerisocia]